MPRSTVQALLAGAAVALMACSATVTAGAQMSKQQQLTPTSTGYADAAEGLRVYYEIYGKGKPIVVVAGALGDISSMTQPIASATPPSRRIRSSSLSCSIAWAS